jgi:hypothetical protein
MADAEVLNIATVDEALLLTAAAVKTAVFTVRSLRRLTDALVRGVDCPYSTDDLKQFLATSEGELVSLLELQARVASTQRLRAQLAALPTGTAQ